MQEQGAIYFELNLFGVIVKFPWCAYQFTLSLCVVCQLFGYEVNLAVWGCVWIGSRASQHGTQTCVCGAAPLPSDREGTNYSSLMDHNGCLHTNSFHRGLVSLETQMFNKYFSSSSRRRLLLSSMRLSSRKRRRNSKISDRRSLLTSTS